MALAISAWDHFLVTTVLEMGENKTRLSHYFLPLSAFSFFSLLPPNSPPSLKLPSSENFMTNKDYFDWSRICPI